MRELKPERLAELRETLNDEMRLVVAIDPQTIASLFAHIEAQANEIERLGRERDRASRNWQTCEQEKKRLWDERETLAAALLHPEIIALIEEGMVGDYKIRREARKALALLEPKKDGDGR